MALSSFPFVSDRSQAQKSSKILLWLRPTFAPEQGVLLVLLGSFLTGAALAQHWNQWTNLALLCAFFTLQVEHPYVVQLKRRKSWKPRFLIWGGIYGITALSIAIILGLHSPILLTVYGLVVVALIADGIAVLHQNHKSIVNEIISFAAISLAAPLAYGATTGHLSIEAVGMWILNTLFFSSAIYTIKLRKKKTRSLKPGIIYHGVSVLILAGLYSLNYLSLITALSFAVALIKFGIVNCVLNWYRQASFHSIAIFETRFALIYVAIASISVLPAHLPPQ
ncbi:YwiC-like family protein [Cyanothece sp. BG0011]|uniref:YwiC-like family protein n=1 Tax=Cyanothece sp. BG0011 TaxID=2082950 RepID=UPI000D1FB6BC|nr:YwiC-like family protein [Cyanothece sp. BG0011]